MPHFHNNILVVTKDELVPRFYASEASLSVLCKRDEKRGQGLKRIQEGRGRKELLILYDSLPSHIRAELPDLRVGRHLLENFFEYDNDAYLYYSSYKFENGQHLSEANIKQYTLNASVSRAVLKLRDDKLSEGANITDVWQELCDLSKSFVSKVIERYGFGHKLPGHWLRFRQKIEDFEANGYEVFISRKHLNDNAKKCDASVLRLLCDMFATQRHKPTRSEVARQYKKFKRGEIEIINSETGELYNPATYPEISEKSIHNYLSQWSQRIKTEPHRAGNRQKLLERYRPYHSLVNPKYSLSVLSIDDRQPPFQYASGKRVWFYNGIDLASECYIVSVYGKSKEMLIDEFYRQLVRNCWSLGVGLPLEIECEMSLNSKYKDTLLKAGNVFEYVRIEANNARGKRIEQYYRQLRYEIEKRMEGYCARPFARVESNEAGVEKAKTMSYEEIVEQSLLAIEEWNNRPHSKEPSLTRWEYFLKYRNPGVKPINWRGLLPYIGYRSESSCNVGIVKFRGIEWLPGEGGEIITGEELINCLQQIEGKSIEIYWLDDNEGKIIKAIVFREGRYVCELVSKPVYQRAKCERTEEDNYKRMVMSKYVATIEGYMKREKTRVEPVTIIEKKEESQERFSFRSIIRKEQEGTEINEEDEIIPVIKSSFRQDLYDRF